MRRPSIRALQTALLVGVGAMLVLVIASLRRPKPGPTPTPTPGASEAPNPGTPRMEGFVIRKLDKDGKEKFVLKAQSMAGQEQDEVRMRGVMMTFPYVSRGAQGNASISAEACVYTPASQKAVFKGSVVVKTEDGLELETDALTYRGDKGVVRTDSALTFVRKDVSGSATGAVYHSEEGTLELIADARLRVEADESGPALEIQSKTAALNREEGALRFDGDARATRGPDVLKGGQITLVYSTEDQSLLGLAAADKVELRTGGATAIPGMPASARGGGSRVLKAARLDVTFRKDRSLENANAGPDAELTILPGRGGPKERHRLKAKFLTFHFDGKGRLQEFEGQREATLAIEAIPPARGETRTIDCRSFAARLDPETGETKNIDFRNDVVIAKGTQKAKADSAWYDGSKSRLTLEKDPEVVDQRDGSSLSAVKIDIGTESGNVDAFREVRHLLGKSTGGPRRMPLGSSEDPTLVTCGVFSFEAKTKTTRYLEGAVLRSGKDEIRAPTLRVIEDKDGNHRLSATEDVVSLFHPKPAPDKAAPAAVETHAKQLAYDESTGQAVYTGDVVIRQADLVSKSPEATMTLAPDGSQIQTVVAGEPVEIQQGARKATGTRATYTPATETLVIVGDKVVLKDPAQEVVGRSLTFHVGDDRILVDGREEVRTETILKKEPPKP